MQDTNHGRKNMKGLVGGPLFVGGLGPGLPGPPLNPALRPKRYNKHNLCRARRA